MRSLIKSRSARNLAISALFIAALIFGNVSSSYAAPRLYNGSALAADLDAAFAVQWMQLTYDHIKAQTVSAPDASRVYAYVGVTLYEAVYNGIPGNVALETQLKAMPAMPKPDAATTYDWPTVAAAAESTVIKGLIPDADTAKAVDALGTQQSKDRVKAGIAQGVLDASAKQGATLGAAMLAWANDDSFKDAHGKTYTLPTGGKWDYLPTTPGTKPVEPFWGTLRPFGLEKSTACDVKLNVELSSDPTSTLYAQAMEVKTVGDNLTDEQKLIASFWVDTPGQTGAPAGHWVSIENQMVTRLSLKLDRAAEMYAMVGMALGDAFIACWQLKYEQPIIRPLTYINRYISPTWKTFIVSPPFPTYTSGHSVASQAAATMLTALFGQVAYKDSTSAANGLAARSFTSFQAAANEAAISRLYGGIHFRMDIENGLVQGRCVGQSVIDRVHLHG